MIKSELEKVINKAFENKTNINEKSDKEILDAIDQTIDLHAAAARCAVQQLRHQLLQCSTVRTGLKYLKSRQFPSHYHC